ncbi:uncharacterized protein LOC125883383 [Epinephelus fuscoguttatus]|uniref:uncharacterized protein LOC125883383 n=1 Tax=Epinephelus fuscoguttatus TaxID=293821 RepID=UPI0020D068FD|nr:uncharacterized protein LOC125883383 [Epinephelus fuscoguttatus]
MRLTSVCGLLLLCVHGNSVDAGNIFDRSSSHNIQRRETNTKRNFSEVMVTKMTVSPTWYVSEGVTVVINCTTHTDDGNYSDKMDLKLFWTKMSPRERIKKVLVSQRASKGISYVLSPVTHEHQGVYTCDDDGSFPHVYVRDWHQILWVDDASPRATIDVVSHSRSQFFNGETFSVSCQLPDDDTQWKMMRFNDFVGNITECPNQVSSGRRLSCTVRSEFPWADVLYWCETPAGERSNALNITTMAGVMVALESPSLPVLEGEDVMLRCLHKNRTTNKITSNFGAIFYRNHRRIRVTTEGDLTLTAVTKADEGIYKCRHPVDGPSHESWITIKARPNEDQKKKSDDVIKTP